MDQIGYLGLEILWWWLQFILQERTYNCCPFFDSGVQANLGAPRHKYLVILPTKAWADEKKSLGTFFASDMGIGPETLVLLPLHCPLGDFLGCQLNLMNVLIFSNFFPVDGKRGLHSSFVVIFDTKLYLQAERADEVKADKEDLSTVSSNQNGISVAHTRFVPCKHESTDISDLQTVLASKEEALTKSSLEVLFQKRQKLVILLD